MDFIVGAVILLIIWGSSSYLIREKKNGNTCAGCGSAGHCSKKSCHDTEE